MERDDPQETYAVVQNDARQYSIWPVNKTHALGWKPVGVQGSKAECLAYIAQAWTDIRPAGLTSAMDDGAALPRLH
jgi:MbtH protein